MKSVLIFLVSLVLLLFGVASSFAHSATFVIKMTADGFEPSEAEVDTNSTVIFLSQDTKPRWPASNLHPTHELYPEFDPKREIAPGESWAFSPKNAGVWKYHDHLNPHIRGALTVNAEGTTLPTKQPTGNFRERLKTSFTNFFKKISGLFTTQKDVTAAEFKKMTPEKQFESLTALAKKKNPQKSWGFLQEVYKGEGGSSGNIHDLAHLAGKLIFEGEGVSGIGLCTTTFSFGCYHGLLDAAFAKSLDGLPAAEAACEKVGPVGSGPYGSCIHGIGHGVASFHQTKDLKVALASCDGLKAGRHFCYDGVLMEFVRGAPASFYSKADPFSPCRELEQTSGSLYSVACGRNQPTVFIQKHGFTFEKAVASCGENALSQDFKTACFEAVGFILASTQDTSKIISGCRGIANYNFQFLCFKAAAGELIFQEVPGWQFKSIQVCDALAGVLRNTCHENRERLIKDYGRTSIEFQELKKGQNKDEYVISQMAICYRTGGADDCYKAVADALSSQFDLKEVLGIFAKNEAAPEIYSRCHEATHYLSRNEYSKMGSIAKVYSSCDSTCHGGCYHGTLEAYLEAQNLGLGEALFSHFPAVCGERKDYTSALVYNECLHGMGHAAMFITDMEIPQSLSLCDTLGAGEPRERCYSGVFMENSSSSTNNDHPGKFTKADDPLYPCNALEEKYQRICWRYQSSYFAMITEHDWKKTADLCLQVPESYRDECFLTVGTNQVGFTQDQSQMRQNCMIMPTDHYKNICIQGVISSFSYRFVGDGDKMINFCKSVDSNFQESCFKQIGVSVLDWENAAKNTPALCEGTGNAQFSHWCRQGAGV